jgi:uncharacterized protein (UPF0332 family)
MSDPGACLDKARQSLNEAQAVVVIGFHAAAGRAAYLAAFHAAQAIILLRTNKVAKTHAGVRSEFCSNRERRSWNAVWRRFSREPTI